MEGFSSRRSCGCGRSSHWDRAIDSPRILGDLLERGRNLDLKTPVLEAAFVHLSVYQRGLALVGRQSVGAAQV
jgi:hypothetical protein